MKIVIRILEKIRKMKLQIKICDGATVNNNRNKTDKSHTDDCDWGSTDSLTSDAKANRKFTVFEQLRKVKLKNINHITISQININSLRNKFSILCKAVHGNISILLVTDTKLDISFPSTQSCIHGYLTLSPWQKRKSWRVFALCKRRYPI